MLCYDTGLNNPAIRQTNNYSTAHKDAHCKLPIVVSICRHWNYYSTRTISHGKFPLKGSILTTKLLNHYEKMIRNVFCVINEYPTQETDMLELSELEVRILLIINDVPEDQRSGEEFSNQIHAQTEEDGKMKVFHAFTRTQLLRLIRKTDGTWHLTDEGQAQVAEIRENLRRAAA